MTPHAAGRFADVIATHLDDPNSSLSKECATDWRRQSLAYGPPGIALLHIELAAVGKAPWQRAHNWLAAASHGPLTSGADSHPFHGAPALAHALACAADHVPGSYQRALEALDLQITTDIQRRLSAAHRRIDAGQLPALFEFDALRGLTGYGAYLLHRDPAGQTLRAVVDYLVRLTEPTTLHDVELPGWWTPSGPSGRPDDRYPEGHGNNGVAHGIGGVLGLLALTARRGYTVTGQHGAIRTVLAWLDRWVNQTAGGPTWPYWITLNELRSSHLMQSGPRRPSWCYGTAGLARIQQLAALVIGDHERRLLAEKALIKALTDPDQLAATTDLGLCHGFAGLAHIAARAAADASPATAHRLRAAIPSLLAAIHPGGAATSRTAAELLTRRNSGPGLLDGAAGIALAALTSTSATQPRSAWDACLLTA